MQFFVTQVGLRHVRWEPLETLEQISILTCESRRPEKQKIELTGKGIEQQLTANGNVIENVRPVTRAPRSS